MATATKREMFENLRRMMREALHLRESGVAHAKLTRAHGYIDGYMQVLIDSGVANEGELLALVASERAAAQGPATREIERDASAAA